MKRKLLLCLPFIALACKTMKQPADQPVAVAFYNVENLFDTENDPQINDEDFLPEGRNKWTPERYQKKLQDLAIVIEKLGDENGPEILGLREIENKKVVEDLVNTEKLKDRNYQVVHHQSPDERGIDVAFVYKPSAFTLITSQAHTINIPENPEFKTRDIQLVQGYFSKNDTVNFIVNPWPSRRGGAEAEVSRNFVASKARSIIDSLQAINPAAKVIMMGDYNDEPNNESISSIINTSDTIVFDDKKKMFNAMGSLKKAGLGTYKFRDNWNMLDQFMLTHSVVNPRKGLGYVDNSAAIYKPEWLLETDERFKGSPFRTYAGERYLGGYSDHFAVYFILN